MTRRDKARQATSPEVKELRHEAGALKEAVAALTLETRLLKKACSGSLGSMRRIRPPSKGWGETTHEVSCIREVGHHPAHRTVPPAGEAPLGHAGYPQNNLRLLV